MTLVGLVDGTRTCRRGHSVSNAGEYWIDAKGRRRCETCRSAQKRIKERPCDTDGCNAILKGTRKRYCVPCQAARAEPSPNDRRTRKCEACRRRLPLREFIVKGVSSTFRDLCARCDDSDGVAGEQHPHSPYEIARREIVEKYGISSKEWMNRADHPLNQLHYHRMVSINNSGKGTVKVPLVTKGRFALLSIYRRVKEAGYIPLKYQQQGTTRGATALRRTTHTQDPHQEAACA